jgi:hypothetical protein
MADLADNSAAVAAGYMRTQTDRGAGRSPRYQTDYEIPLVGEPNATGQNWRAVGYSDTSQAAADTAALAALNGQRNLRYGTGTSGNENVSAKTGAKLTRDKH